MSVPEGYELVADDCSRLTKAATPLLQMIEGMWQSASPRRAPDLLESRRLVEEGLALALKAAALRLEPRSRVEQRP